MSVRLGDRDMHAMQWLAEQYGAPMDAVADCSGRHESAYRIALRWRAAGLCAKPVRPVPGPSWVFPTRQTAEAMLGFYVPLWLPTPMMAADTAAVGRVRMALSGDNLDRWTSERLLRKDQGPTAYGQTRPHLHDGHWTDDLGRVHAIEVELSRKGSRQAKVTVAAAVDAAANADATASSTTPGHVTPRHGSPPPPHR